MTITVIEPLTENERAQLTVFENHIQQAWYLMATALDGIRKGRLYRESHTTFNDYCREKCGFSASRARQLVAGAKTRVAIETVTGVTIPNESVARAVRSKPGHQQIHIVRAASKNAESDGKPLSTSYINAAARTYAEAERTGSVSVNGESNPITKAIAEDVTETKARQRQHIDDKQGIQYLCKTTGYTDERGIYAARPAEVPVNADVVIVVYLKREETRQVA